MMKMRPFSDTALRQLAFQLNGGRSDNKVTVVNGAPGSGKSTYVQTHRSENDLILDLDTICQALNGGKPLYADREPVLSVALKVRNTVLEAIRNRDGKWNHAYVITSEVNQDKVRDLAIDLQAEIYTMPTSLQQCLEQICHDERRAENVQEHIRLAKNWYSANANANAERH